MTIKEDIIKFCIENSGKEEIDFSIFKESTNLFLRFGINSSLNTFKGQNFELLLTELFLGNGYIVDRIGEGGNDGGCDLLVKHPKDLSIIFVIQAKNWKKAIDISDIEKEWLKFNRNYKKQNSLNNGHFCFVAWDYVKGIKNKITSELNINVWDEQDIINNLFKKYKSQFPKYPSIQLKSYQETAFNNIIHFWNNNKRCYVEHATGSGKTYIIAKIVETLITNKDNKVLIISPSSYINRRIRELVETVVPTSLIAIKPNTNKVINILTYQYLYHNADEILTDSYTHIIMDEAHRAGAPKWNKTGLLPIINASTKIVGLSATMDRYSSGIDVKEFLENNCAGELSLFRAITQGILPSIGKYVYSVQDINSKINEVKLEVNSKYNKFPKKKKRVLSILDAKQIKDYSIQNVLFKHYHAIQYQKIIVFCEGYEHTNEIRRLLDNTFAKFSKVKIEKVTSKQSKKENMAILTSFSGEKPRSNQINIIVAIDMLNEGIDVSGIDSIMLFRKTESPRIYLQQIGRVLRSHGKNNPLIFDCVLNYQNVKINLTEEFKNEVDRYQKSLDYLGFTDIEVPKTIKINDEVKGISVIIEEVEAKLNFYRSYDHAKEAVFKLGIKSESEYRKNYRKDPRLPSKPEYIYRNKGWNDWYDFLGTERPVFYLTYEEAKNATQTLKIKSNLVYKKRYKEDLKLPSQPNLVYKNTGWINWYDFFGTESPNIYPTYIEASRAAKKIGIKTYTSYKKRFKEDIRLPRQPNRTYRNNGWISFYEFLGIEKATFYKSYEDAKQAVSNLNIKTEKEYRLRNKEDLRLPSSPERHYKHRGWIDNYDFYNKKRPRFYESYREAKTAVKKLKIRTRKEYSLRYYEDVKLPSNPEIFYREKGWVDNYSFFGKKTPEYYKSYNEAKAVVKKLNIKSREEYVKKKRYKEDLKLPSSPHIYYRNAGWKGWEEFVIIRYLTYEEARNAVQKLGIKTRTDYLEYKLYKEDKLLPSTPEKRYKNIGWIDWYNFLGTEEPSIYSTYQEAKMAVHRLKIKSMKEYKARRSEDQQLPSSPSECYKNKGWISFKDFCGLEKIEYYKTYLEAKKAVQKLGIKNRSHYQEKKQYKMDSRLPSTPDILYKLIGWKDWPSFLGIKKINIYPTYEEAKLAVQKLGIKTGEAYRKKRLYLIDPRLPSTPEMKYRNKGWVDFYDFLGNESPNKYSTYEEAKQAAHILKIKSKKEFHHQKRYLEDIGLTCNPDRKFKNKGWISWEDFLGY